MQEFSAKNFSEIDPRALIIFMLLTVLFGSLFSCIIFLLHFAFQFTGSVTLCALGALYSLIAILLYRQVALALLARNISYIGLALTVTAKVAMLLVLFFSLRGAGLSEVISVLLGIHSFVPAAIALSFLKERPGA